MNLMIEDFAADLARNRQVFNIVETMREGWNNYAFFFYIGSVSVILGAVFGLTGFVGILFTAAFFYYAGRFHKGWKKTAEEHVKKG